MGLFFRWGIEAIVRVAEGRSLATNLEGSGGKEAFDLLTLGCKVLVRKGRTGALFLGRMEAVFRGKSLEKLSFVSFNLALGPATVAVKDISSFGTKLVVALKRHFQPADSRIVLISLNTCLAHDSPSSGGLGWRGQLYPREWNELRMDPRVHAAGGGFWKNYNGKLTLKIENENE